MDYLTQSCISDLKNFLQECKQEKPDLQWCESYERMRHMLRQLKLYQFCPAYFEQMLRLVVERAERGENVPDYVLQSIRTWYNKARGYVRAKRATVYVEPDLDLLLGEHYVGVSAHLFSIFSRWIKDAKKGEIVRGFITGLRLTDEQQQWLTENWIGFEPIVQRLLMYPEVSPVITRWVSEKAMHEGALLHRLPELVGRMLSADQEYVLTVEDVLGMMEKVRVDWPHLIEYYETDIKHLLQTRNLEASKYFDFRSGEQNMKEQEDTIDWLEERRLLHPSLHYRVYFLYKLLTMGLHFSLKPNPYHLSYIGTWSYSHFWERHTSTYSIDDEDFDPMRIPKKEPGPVANFYQSFQYIDINATLKEWQSNALRIRDESFYRGIFRSRLPQATKDELYKRYYTPELNSYLIFCIKEEKNIVMAEWLIDRISK